MKGRHEIGGGETEAIVANSGIQQEQPARTLAEFGGLACRFDLDGAKSIGTDPGQQLAVRGLRNVEAIEHDHCLIGFCARDVGLSVHIQHDAGNEVERVAIVMGGGIRDVEYIESAEGLLRGDLGGIDSWRGLDHIDDLAHLLLVGERDLNVGNDVRNIEVRRACLDRR